MINYSAEVARLNNFVPGSTSKFWKPKPGQYRVKALSELEEAEPYHEEGKEDKKQAKIDLLVGEDRVTWTVGVTASPASAYGQLCNLAINKGGHLKDIEFMIVVTNDKKKNSYTIVTL